MIGFRNRVITTRKLGYHLFKAQTNFLRCVFSFDQNSFSSMESFDSSKLHIVPAVTSQLKKKPDVKDLGFGKYFTDHMLTVRWNALSGWSDPKITPLQPFQIHPAAKVFHYAQELFEGMKAYRGVDDQIRLFRPMHNMMRMNISAQRASLPTFDGHELMHCIRKLIQMDQEWVPHSESSSLYIRPTMIGIEPILGITMSKEVELFVILTPVGPYFKGGLKPINLLADRRFVRAWKGGSGYAKMGSNYAPTLYCQKVAEELGCQQCLWLGEDDEITEVGAMNIAIILRQPNSNALELVTPPLDNGVILPGITRRSMLEITREWNEFKVSERKITMKDVLRAKTEERLVEIFGIGTAAVVTPIGNVFYEGKMQSIPNNDDPDQISKRLFKALSDIYYGHKKHPWAVNVESWEPETPLEQDRLRQYGESISQHVVYV